jgi:hypothetical protein
MHPEEFFDWWLPPARPGGLWQRSLSKMTREQARDYPGAERDDSSKEIRWVPDDADEVERINRLQERARRQR